MHNHYEINADPADRSLEAGIACLRGVTLDEAKNVHAWDMQLMPDCGRYRASQIACITPYFETASLFVSVIHIPAGKKMSFDHREAAYYRVIPRNPGARVSLRTSVKQPAEGPSQVQAGLVLEDTVMQMAPGQVLNMENISAEPFYAVRLGGPLANEEWYQIMCQANPELI
jgi:hypothetical protein